MFTFKEYLDYLEEAVADVSKLKRKPLSQRTPKEQAAINAAKANKPKKGKVEVHLKHEDGTISKSSFNLKGKEHKQDEEAKTIADEHLKNMQYIYDRFPTVSGSRAVEVHKIVIK